METGDPSTVLPPSADHRHGADYDRFAMYRGMRPHDARRKQEQEDRAMNSVYSICEREGRQWCITLGRRLVGSQLCPATAIKLARRLAREYHDVTGFPSRVIFLGGKTPIVLGTYGVQ